MRKKDSEAFLMIIEKAVDKAKKSVDNRIFFLKDENTEAKPAEEQDSSKQVSSNSRVVEIDQDDIATRACLTERSSFGVIESYNILRTRLHQRLIENNWNSLMVTSASDTEGKTLTAINLAISFSKHYHQTVLLVDCDLRKQNIYRYLGYSQSYNLVDHLLDQVPLSDVMVRLKNYNMSVISGKKTVDSGAEILGSSQMTRLFQELKNRYNDRIIIYDLPPILLLADAIACTSWIDSILFVVQYGKTSFQDIQKSLDRLPIKKFLGFVINRSKADNNKYDKY
jgi:non-specific protein-tyrosine kinase